MSWSSTMKGFETQSCAILTCLFFHPGQCRLPEKSVKDCIKQAWQPKDLHVVNQQYAEAYTLGEHFNKASTRLSREQLSIH